ncbi:MAG: methyltransferase, partial [Pseudomonadota bacterium]
SERIKEIINFNMFSAMLDLGGGIGTYAVSFARENRDLKATIVDLKDVVRHAGAYIKKAGMTDRIQVAAGQCLEDPLPKGPFDLVFISNLIHIYDSPGCKKIIAKAVKVLSDKGTLVIHDYIFGSGDCVAVALFDMTMLVGTPQGTCYERKEIEAWMRQGGITNIISADVLAGTSIIWGQKA